MIDRYKGKSIGVIPPHSFAIADFAYRSMKSDRINQSIMISGESGAGKTETAKHVMKFLVKVGAGKGEVNGVENRILETNPLMEAFGNAKTLRNNNSSRFGKFIRIHFNQQAQVEGATIDTYLLEKARIVQQPQGNRNYHIFYNLCLGASPEQKQKYHLLAPEQYHYLNQGGDYRIKGLDDAHEFKVVVKAMESIGIKEADRDLVWKVIAGCLTLGNITFQKKAGGKDECEVANKDVLATAAELLDVKPSVLGESLVMRTMTTRGESFRIPLPTAEASNSRDSLVKFIYHRLFNWLCYRVNQSLISDESRTVASIAVLDIFGFEYFQDNGFEQFCINYCNERLQQQFNSQIFKQELDIYKKEGIKAPTVNFIDNQDCIDLIDKIIGTIDEQCRLKPNSNPETLASAIHTKYGSHPRVEAPKVGRGAQNLSKKEAFLIKHYAADVTYKTANFLDANDDSIHQDLMQIINSSTNPMLLKFSELDVNAALTRGGTPQKGAAAAPAKGGSAGPTGGRFNSVASQFAQSLRALVNSMNNTVCHFIRCIKPNQKQVPDLFEELSILDQIRCNGMVDALSLMHAGFPTRCPYDILYNRFKPVMPKELHNYPPANFVEAILLALECDRKDFQLGLTRVFFRSGKLAFLEELRGQGEAKIDPALVLKVKRFLSRKRLKAAMWTVWCMHRMLHRIRCLRALKVLLKGQHMVKMMAPSLIRLSRKVRIRGAAVKIQSVVRMFLARRRYRRARKQMILLQRMIRGFLARKKYGPELARRRKARQNMSPEEAAKLRAEVARIKGEGDARKRAAEEREAELKRLANRSKEEVEAERRRMIEEERRQREERAEAERLQREQEAHERKMKEIQEHVDRQRAEWQREADAKAEEAAAVLAERDAKLAATQSELAAKIKSHEAESSDLNNRLKDLKEEIERLRAKLAKKEEELSSAQSKLRSANDENSSLKAEIEGLKDQLRGKEDELASAKSRIKTLEKQIAEAEERLGAANTEGDSVKAEKQKLADKARQQQAKIDELSAALAASQAEASATTQQLESLQRANAADRDRLSKASSEASSLETRVADLNREITEISQQLAQAKADAQRNQSKATAAQQQGDLKAREQAQRIDELEQQVEALSADKRRSQEESRAAKNREAALREEVEQAQSQLSEVTSKLGGVPAEVIVRQRAEQQAKISALNGEIARLHSELEEKASAPVGVNREVSEAQARQVREFSMQLTEAIAREEDLKERLQAAEAAALAARSDAQRAESRYNSLVQLNQQRESQQADEQREHEEQREREASQRRALQDEIRSLKNREATASARADTLAAELDEINAKLGGLPPDVIARQKSELSQRCNALQGQLAQLNTELETRVSPMLNRDITADPSGGRAARQLQAELAQSRQKEAELADSLALAQQALELAKSDTARQQARITNLMQQLEQRESQSQEERRALIDERDAEINAKRAQQDEVRAAKTREATAAARAQAAEEQLREVQEKLGGIPAEVVVRQRNEHQQRSEQLFNQLRQLQAELDSVPVEVPRQREVNPDRERSLGALTLENTQLKIQLSEAQEMLGVYQASAADAKRRLETVSAKASDRDQELTARLSSTEAQLNALMLEKGLLTAELERKDATLKADTRGVQIERDELARENERLQTRISELTDRLRESKSRLRASNSAIIPEPQIDSHDLIVEKEAANLRANEYMRKLEEKQRAMSELTELYNAQGAAASKSIGDLKHANAELASQVAVLNQALEQYRGENAAIQRDLKRITEASLQQQALHSAERSSLISQVDDLADSQLGAREPQDNSAEIQAAVAAALVAAEEAHLKKNRNLYVQKSVLRDTLVMVTAKLAETLAELRAYQDAYAESVEKGAAPERSAEKLRQFGKELEALLVQINAYDDADAAGDQYADHYIEKLRQENIQLSDEIIQLRSAARDLTSAGARDQHESQRRLLEERQAKEELLKRIEDISRDLELFCAEHKQDDQVATQKHAEKLRLITNDISAVLATPAPAAAAGQETVLVRTPSQVRTVYSTISEVQPITATSGGAPLRTTTSSITFATPQRSVVSAQPSYSQTFSSGVAQPLNPLQRFVAAQPATVSPPPRTMQFAPTIGNGFAPRPAPFAGSFTTMQGGNVIPAAYPPGFGSVRSMPSQARRQ
eukprot:TRINITY_DN447_c0_g1_i1.p1 TRINITY_DN447_c0_g1~~TRINITY_DN447_c0_g1_i1.p1  ORF type:complete len:2271 (-),score=688.57 TRINITY_DN447_c0_g1_i1:82-6540(-)